MNHVIIAGHLGADPEVRFTSSGEKVTTLRVAARSRRSGKEETTIWWKVTVWREQFDKMMPYFKKGSPIFVMGELNKPEIFTDRAGNPQISMSLTAYNISFSPFGRPDSAGGSDHKAAAPEASHAAHSESHPESVAQGQGKGVSFSDEEVPF